MTIAASALNTKPADTGVQKPATSENAASSRQTYDVQLLRSGDPDEFDKLVAAESPRIHRLVERLLGWNDREDLTQEVFIAAWQSLHGFRGDSEVSTWLYAIAIRLCRNHRRRTGWLERFSTLERQLLARSNHAGSTGTYDEIEQIKWAMNRLSHQDRETIVLCCLEEKSVQQVAGMLNQNKNTIEVRLHRARKQLKQILADIENE